MECVSSRSSSTWRCAIDARPWRRLALAAALSGAAHAAFVVLGRLDAPPPPEDPLPLAVTIVNTPVTQPSRAAKPPTPPAPAVSAPRRAAPPPVLVAPSWPGPAEVAELALGEDAPVLDTISSAGDTAVTATEPFVVATAPSSTYVPELPPVRSLPRKGRVTYSLVYGRDRFPVGRTTQTWEMDGGAYRLASRSETTGLIDLFRSQHRTYFSRGSLTRDGLRPETFLMSRDRGRGTEEARAQFDWDGATVTLASAAGKRIESLPPGSQDLLSFMYQLSLDPPRTGRLQQVVTNGSRIEVYDLDVLPEETIETPLGALRALPLKQLAKPGQEAIELWLATEYRHLPVRIRFFNREGEPQGEQIVTEIRLSDD